MVSSFLSDSIHLPESKDPNQCNRSGFRKLKKRNPAEDS
jgi:hypothetical protein